MRRTEEPKKVNFLIKSLKHVSERYCHFPNSESEYYEDDCEDDPSMTGKLPDRQSIPLKSVLELIEKKQINPEEVFFTASFSDDYLCLEVVHIKKLNEEEQEKDYKAQRLEWEKRQERRKEEELDRIKMQMESLQRQTEKLLNQVEKSKK